MSSENTQSDKNARCKKADASKPIWIRSAKKCGSKQELQHLVRQARSRLNKKRAAKNVATVHALASQSPPVFRQSPVPPPLPQRPPSRALPPIPQRPPPPPPRQKSSSNTHKESSSERKESYDAFFDKHGGTIFWTIFIASTVGLLAYENNYPTTKSAPKSLVIVMDIVFVVMMLFSLYAFKKYWSRYDTSKGSETKKRLVWLYRLMFLFGLGFWTYYHFSVVPKARKDRKKAAPGLNFLHKLSIPAMYISLFTLQALTLQ